MQIEYNSTIFKEVGNIGNGIMITPPINEDYWSLRVKVSDDQAIVAFPKFNTFGIGFAVEDDWNTNLPYTSTAKDIFTHIAHNKGNNNISDSDCIKAIKMIQEELKQLAL